MKRRITICTFIFILMLSGCKSLISLLNTNDSSNIYSNDVNIQTNLMHGGTLIENKDILIFNNYIYNKSSGEITMLCKDSECSHELGVGYAEDICIMHKGVNSLQIYNNDIFCSVSSGSNDIHKLDHKTGSLSVFYNGDISINSFRFCSDENVIINSNVGLYSVDLNSGVRIKLVEGTIDNAAYTNDVDYLYVSMEDLSIHRIRLDGTEDIVLTTNGNFPVIYENKLYYSYSVEDDWCLKSINIDGTDDKVVIDDMMMYTVYNDNIYYSTASYPRKIMMCDINGRNNKELMSGTASFLILPYSQKILLSMFNGYFNDTSYMIMNPDGSDIKDFPVPVFNYE